MLTKYWQEMNSLDSEHEERTNHLNINQQLSKCKTITHF